MNPILGIGQTDGAMARIVNQTGSGVVFGWEDLDSVASYINLCWNSFNAGQEADPARAEQISRYSRKALAASMAALLENVSERVTKK